MVNMLWEDKTLVGAFCAPKFCHVLVICITTYISYWFCHQTLLHGKNMQVFMIILIWLYAGYLAFLGLSSLLLVVKGNKYVRLVKQLGTTFIFWNIHHEEFMFAQEDVREVKLVKYSFMDQILIGLAKYKPGYHVYLSNGKKFFITAEMDNLETLTAALIGSKE